MQLITNYTNVFFDTNAAFTFDQLNEKEYILNVLQELHLQLGSSFDNFCFIIFSANGIGHTPKSADQQFPGKKKVLFYLSDESGEAARELEGSYYRIFKSYLPPGIYKNIYPFPLGQVNNIRFAESEIKKISAREISAFFSGNLNENRIAFFKQFSWLKIPVTALKYLIRIPLIKKMLLKTVCRKQIANSFINFTYGFKQGLSAEAYKQHLLNAKIVFCPAGFISTETFRHYEAMAAGCIIISEKLPENLLYKTAPIIQVSDWKAGIAIALKLLNNIAELEQLQQNSIDFWRKNYSESAVAGYVKIHL